MPRQQVRDLLLTIQIEAESKRNPFRKITESVDDVQLELNELQAIARILPEQFEDSAVRIQTSMKNTKAEIEAVGKKTKRFGMISQQLSFGLQDVATSTGDWTMRLRGLSNNLAQALTFMGPMIGAVGGLAVTLVIALIPALARSMGWLNKTKDELDSNTKSVRANAKMWLTLTDVLNRYSKATKLGTNVTSIALLKLKESDKKGVGDELSKINLLGFELKKFNARIQIVIDRTLFAGRSGFRKRFFAAGQDPGAKPLNPFQQLKALESQGGDKTLLAGKIRLNFVQKLLSLNKDNLDIRKEHNELDRESITNAEKKIELATKRAQIASDELRSAQASIGRLGAEDRVELTQLTSRKESGDKLSLADLQRLEQLAGSIKGIKDLVEKDLAIEGAKLTDRVSKAFLGQELSKSTSKLQKEVSVEIQKQKLLISNLENIINQRGDAILAILNMMGKLADVEEVLEEEIAALEAKMQDIILKINRRKKT